MSGESANLPCDFEAELPLLLYQGELAREERERLKSHVATCPRCEEALSQLETTAIALDGALAVPKPSPEQWAKLKEDVLARVAAPAAAAESSASAETPCEGVEEDLLVLNEVGPERKKEILQHLEACGSCRDARSAFGSIGIVLNRQPLEWPAVERWDSLKENVLGAIRAEAGPPPRESQRVARPALVRPWQPLVTKIAAAVVLVAALGGSYALLRGPSADEVRRQYTDAQGTTVLEQAKRAYERVEKNGLTIPECQAEVDDARLQLLAIHRFEAASAQPNFEAKRQQLLDVIVSFPTARVTGLALDEYNKLLPPPPPEVPPRPALFTHNGFDDGMPFRIDQRRIHRYSETLMAEYKKLSEIYVGDELAKRQAELKPALVVSILQSAEGETNHTAAVEQYNRVLEFADPNSQAAQIAKRHIAALTAAH